MALRRMALAAIIGLVSLSAASAAPAIVLHLAAPKYIVQGNLHEGPT